MIQEKSSETPGCGCLSHIKRNSAVKKEVFSSWLPFHVISVVASLPVTIALLCQRWVDKVHWPQ